MCGIAGLVLGKTNSMRPELLAAMSKALIHRGPDDHGYLTWARGPGARFYRDDPPDSGKAEVAFAHRRLSILDVSAAGRQPMTTPDRRYAITYNGEIYNYLELRAELQAKGWVFHTGTDTEVLLYGYVQWGKEVLTRLQGMFAFALLDVEKQTVLLARDHFGIKPLFYHRSKVIFAFASEIKALLLLPEVRRTVNAGALYDYLRFSLTDHGEETFYTEIRQLPPAHYLELHLDSFQDDKPVRYWDLNLDNRSTLSFENAAEQLRELFLNNIRLHLRSDVPVGAAASGGIDSSAIVMAMRKVEPGLELHTFSYIADDPMLSEERWVDVVSRAGQTAVHKVHPTPDELAADVDNLIIAQDEPFGSTSIYAQSRVFRLARETGIKVMLDGQGADELLAGYTGYHAARMASLLSKGCYIAAMNYFNCVRRQPQVSGLGLLARTGGKLMPDRFRPFARKMIGEDLAPKWLNGNWFSDRGVKFGRSDVSFRDDMLRSELKRSLQHILLSLLRYEDRNSMAYSIESRVPFLTPQFAEFILSLPEDYLISGKGTSKAVFRKAMRGIVPDSILDRKDKIGFQTPEQSWLVSLQPWIERIIEQDTLDRIPALNAGIIREEWRAIKHGRRRADAQLWRWLNVGRWAELKEINIASQ
jgi:asparagine synthase (glutamine-hydrolysing)